MLTFCPISCELATGTYVGCWATNMLANMLALYRGQAQPCPLNISLKCYANQSIKRNTNCGNLLIRTVEFSGNDSSLHELAMSGSMSPVQTALLLERSVKRWKLLRLQSLVWTGLTSYITELGKRLFRLHTCDFPLWKILLPACSSREHRLFVNECLSRAVLLLSFGSGPSWSAVT